MGSSFLGALQRRFDIKGHSHVAPPLGHFFMTETQKLSTNLFDLSIRQTESRTNMTMYVYGPVINTVNLPQTHTILKNRLPTILKAKCFNYAHLPFKKEVRQTEIGHLFEHLVLEYMCRLKLAHGECCAKYSGVTNWNWKRDTRGTFHISMDVGKHEEKIFKMALEKSLTLIQEIMLSEEKVFVEKFVPLQPAFAFA